MNRRSDLTADQIAAFDRIGEKLKGNPEAAARLQAHIEGKVNSEEEPSVSDLVRLAIADSGLSLNELSRRTGVDPAALSRFMSGERGITLETFERLADEVRLRVIDRRFAFGFPDEWDDFEGRNADFRAVFPALVETTRIILVRRISPRSNVEIVVFHLANVCREDFFEILLMCSNGYGIGGLKLLRGLYERAVTVGYLVNLDREEATQAAERFVRYGDVQRGKKLQHDREIGNLDDVSRDVVARLEDLAKSARPLFQQTACKKCKTKQLMHSWDSLDLKVMAQRAGPPESPDRLFRLYGECSLDPTSHIHSTLRSVSDRLDFTAQAETSFDSGPQREIGDHALMRAHELLVAVLEMQNRCFQLGLDSEIRDRLFDFSKAWRRLNRNIDSK